MNPISTRPLALIGANGMLARKVRELAPADFAVHGFDLPQFDLTDPGLVGSALAVLQPVVIVNCAAYTNVDGCESDSLTAFRVNGEGPGVLAGAARDLGATLVHISTDYVFSGEGHTPLREEDPTGPRSVYGRSKLQGEAAIAASGLERYFILRTSWLYGPGGKNFVETMVRLAGERDELRVVADQVGSPTYTGDLAAAVFHLLGVAEEAEREGSMRRGKGGTGPRSPSPVPRHRPYGLYHFADAGQCSWHGFAEAILAQAREHGLPVRTRQVVPIATADYPLPAPRPAWSVLDTSRYRQVTGQAVPAWPESLARYFAYDRNRS